MLSMIIFMISKKKDLLAVFNFRAKGRANEERGGNFVNLLRLVEWFGSYMIARAVALLTRTLPY